MSTDKIQVDQLLDLGPRKVSEAERELLPVFDDTNNLAGYAPRYLCHTLGLTHKVALCYLIDATGRLLLQTRGDGRLDVAVAGHMSIDDDDEMTLVCREAKEETGLELRRDAIKRVAKYKRVSPVRADKPNERNIELRELFVYQMSSDEIRRLSEIFAGRLEKSNVTSLCWFFENDVLTACSMGKVADGLLDTIGWYLNWSKQPRQAITQG